MQSKNNSILVIVSIFVLLITSYSAGYIIPEGRQVVITQFGKPVKSVSDAGLHFKLPFIQDVRMIDLRILSWDGYPNQIPTKDKKYIEVDTTARWKVTDPLKFIQTVQNERGAKSRLDAILDGITRDVVSSHNLVEAVRNSNNILDLINKKKEQFKIKKKQVEQSAGEGDSFIEGEEEITGEIELIEIGREKLSQEIVKRALEELQPLGIELIDVQFKRISYEKSVQKKVFDRMISERERIAGKIRSYGKGEKAKIEGKTQKDLNSIQSEAYRKVQKIRGAAEGKAIAIYAKALSKDPGFYRFTRNLEAYEKALPPESKLLLSSQSKFWQIMKSGRVE